MLARDYIGVLDDVIARYHPVPYATERFFAAVLAEGVLYGAPGLLNDGYLVQHPVLRGQLESRAPAFVDLLKRDWLTVASAIRPPSASIERRARVGVASHRALVASDDWPVLAAAIDDLPRPSIADPVAWPSRDLTDGFAMLAERLHNLADAGEFPEGRDLPPSGEISDFVDAFLRALGRHHEAPRTQWEALAARTWSANARAFHAMMDLANLVYHLNIAMLFGADDPSARTVVTRDSPLLAPLLGLGRMDETLELPEFPFIDAPVLTPVRIAAILEDGALAAFRNDEGRAPNEEATLVAYLDALGRTEHARDVLVAPISRARIEEDGKAPLLRFRHVAASQSIGHVRLTIPQSLCDRHASKARPFGQAS